MEEQNYHPHHYDARTNLRKLKDDNYHTWKQRMQMILIKEDLWEVISDPTPVAPDDKWIRKDRLAQASIGLAVDDKMLLHIKHETTAKEVWKKLSQIHQQDSLGSRLTLHRKIFSSRYHMGNDMSEHINDMLEAVSKLEDRGYILDPELICAALLGSLPREFNTLITSMEARPTSEINITYLREKIMEEHSKHCGERKSYFNAKAMHTNSQYHKSSRPGPTCFYCKKVGHIRKDCRLLKQHESHQSFIKNKKTSKTSSRGNRSTTEQLTALTLEDDENTQWPQWSTDETNFKAMTTKANPNQKRNNNQWIIDSGASAHMVNSLSLLDNVKKYDKPCKIITASGNIHSIYSSGEYSLKLINDQQEHIMVVLKDVMYSPELTDNLISVSQLTTQGYSLNFKQDQCWINKGNIQAKLAVLKNQLYFYTPTYSPKKTEGRTLLCQHIMHERMGHRQIKDIPNIQEHLTSGEQCNHDGLCVTCNVTKMTNKPFQKSTRERAKRPFDIFHLDLCGPIKPTTLGNNNYILHLIDDYSRHSTVFLINNKQQAAQKITEYIEHGINVFERRPKIMRSDGGGEFLNQDFKQYLKSKGIKHQISLPYTPQNNGTVERANRTLIETTRALLHQTHLPKYLWGEMASTAAYLNNRTLHKDLHATPQELWTQRKINNDHLRTIGTSCYYLNTHPDRKKMDNRGIAGILIGYGESSRVYRIWNPQNAKISMTRCVNFEPEKCPLAKKAETLDFQCIQPTHQELVLTDETTDSSTNINSNVRKSSRSNKGKPPNILSYDHQGHIDVTKDYHQFISNDEEDET